MRYLFLTLIGVMLISPASAQDVYFCNSLADIRVEQDETKKFKPQNFKMLVTQSSITITGDNYFDGTKFDVDLWVAGNFWEASKSGGYIAFNEPDFNFAFLGYDTVKIITARCDKF